MKNSLEQILSGKNISKYEDMSFEIMESKTGKSKWKLEAGMQRPVEACKSMLVYGGCQEGMRYRKEKVGVVIYWERSRDEAFLLKFR